MSLLNVIYRGRKITYHWKDGKSDLLERFINLDDSSMYYIMGKQIGGKPINPNGKLGKKLFEIAWDLVDRGDFKKNTRSPEREPLLSRDKKNNGKLALILILIGLLFSIFGNKGNLIGPIIFFIGVICGLFKLINGQKKVDEEGSKAKSYSIIQEGQNLSKMLEEGIISNNQWKILQTDQMDEEELADLYNFLSEAKNRR